MDETKQPGPVGFLVNAETRGGHTHITFWVGRRGFTRQNVGRLVMEPAEAGLFIAALGVGLADEHIRSYLDGAETAPAIVEQPVTGQEVMTGAIPANIQLAIDRAFQEGVVPGGFTRRVLCGQLEAISVADPDSRASLLQIWWYLCGSDTVPGNAWGTPLKFWSWMAEKQGKISPLERAEFVNLDAIVEGRVKHLKALVGQ